MHEDAGSMETSMDTRVQRGDVIPAFFCTPLLWGKNDVTLWTFLWTWIFAIHS
jgi:hypothetical protein